MIDDRHLLAGNSKDAMGILQRILRHTDDMGSLITKDLSSPNLNIIRREILRKEFCREVVDMHHEWFAVQIRQEVWVESGHVEHIPLPFLHQPD